MLLPKRVKYRRVHRGRMKGKATRGNFVSNGSSRDETGHLMKAHTDVSSTSGSGPHRPLHDQGHRAKRPHA